VHAEQDDRAAHGDERRERLAEPPDAEQRAEER
jgi:hypothetical protein